MTRRTLVPSGAGAAIPGSGFACQERSSGRVSSEKHNTVISHNAATARANRCLVSSHANPAIPMPSKPHAQKGNTVSAATLSQRRA